MSAPSAADGSAANGKDRSVPTLQPPATVSKPEGVGRFMANLLAGAGSGAITKTAVAPLDRVKILQQVQGMMKGSNVAMRYPPSVSGTLRKIVQDEGFAALYKGNGVNVLRVIPVYALKFSFNDKFVEMVKRPGQARRDVGFLQLMAAGSMAGLFQTTITYPMEVIRTRLTMPTQFGNRYAGIADCTRRTVAEEGWAALYKGYSATLVSGGPYVGLQMSFYELYKRMMPRDEAGRTPLFWKLSGGAMAGLTAQFCTYPVDTVRRRIQADGIGGTPKKYASTWECFVSVGRHEGLLAYFRGGSATVVRSIPSAAIQFAAYDTLKHMLHTESSE